MQIIPSKTQYGALLCGLFWFALITGHAATVITDKEDYPPYSIVWISGAGFQPGETVRNQITQVAGPAPGTAYEPWEVVADTNGNLETEWFVFSDELLNTTLKLTSTGLSSGISANTLFTDAGTSLGTAAVVSPVGGFGIDGDLLANTPTNGVGDWVTNAAGSGGFVLKNDGAPLNPAFTFHVIDLFNSNSDDNFGGGDKVNENPATWGWVRNPVGNKVDINNAVLHLTTATNGHQWAVVSGDRLSDSGTAYIDFEFLQNTLLVTTNVDGISGGFASAGPHGGRTTNDFLLTVALTGGGSVASFFVQQWKFSGVSAGVTNYDYFDVNISTLPTNSVFAAVNTNNVSVPYGAFGTNIYIKNLFAEAAVDLTALIGTAFDSCTSIGVKTLMVKTKQSDAPSANISDMITPIQVDLTVGLADAGPAQSKCTEGASTTFTLNGSAHPNVNSVSNISWSVLSGPATIDTPTNCSSCISLPATVEMNSTNGTATLRLTVVDSAGCTKTDDIIITVNPLPACSIIGNTVLCPLSTSNIYNAPIEMTNYAWIISGNASIEGGTNGQSVNVTAGGICASNFTLTLTVTSSNGCASTCEQTFSVSDTLAPVLAGVPTNQTFQCAAPVPPLVTATDNCDTNVVVSLLSVTNGSCPKLIVHTWTATDRCSNSVSVSVTNTIEDTLAPVLAGVPTNQTFQCLGDVPEVPLVNAIDNCDNNPLVNLTSETNGTCPVVIVRTWTARDACGNTNRASQTNVINDTIAPVMNFVPNKIMACNESFSFDEPTATDNCTLSGNIVISVMTNTVATNFQGQVIHTRTWKAVDACNNSSTNCTQIVTVNPCPPCISVTKEITCFQPILAQGGPVDNYGNFGKSATGVSGDTQNPAFCYRISVTNCGEIGLTNVTVIDSMFGDLTTNFFASPEVVFQPGATVEYIYKAEHETNVTNTVSIAGQSVFDAVSTNADSSAEAKVLRATVGCRTTLFAQGDLDPGESVVMLPDDGLPHQVTWSIVVVNTGEADLENINIYDLGCTPTNVIVASLKVGQSVTNVLCMALVDCHNAPITNTVVVTASVDTDTNQFCTTDIYGTNVMVRSECSAVVLCEKGGCRTTGGGRQPGSSTYTAPGIGDAPRFVTHGGQVGAPLGKETAFDPDSDCIRGRLTHVRHIKGGLKGNFQARSFDSLMSACLGGTDCTNAIPVAGEICNAGNSNGCGPEPRKASANKVAFSGVGNYTLTNGRRTPRTVLFRVDLEDRSEPGGGKPGGANPPADRYRIRLWVLSASELAQLNNSADKFCAFRQAIAANSANVVVQDGAPGALGSAVFGVRAPDIDDGGELERGNEQIHPMTKDCNSPIHTCP
ncbi:MAG: hypothetical protein ABIR24_04255 [Verrucomicrobiota bacterium]